MKLVSIEADCLKIQDPLPFGLRNEAGRLVLPPNGRISDRQHLEELLAEPLFADADESMEWRRRRMAAMDAMLRQNAPLSALSQARPTQLPTRANTQPVVPKPSPQVLRELGDSLEAVQRDSKPGPDWPQRVQDLLAKTRSLMERGPDAMLYLLHYNAAHNVEQYSTRHALFCFALAHESAAVLGWPAELSQALLGATLTMNIAVRRLQDQLAASDLRITPEMKAQLDTHAQDSATQLAAFGVADAQWLEIVRHHHDAEPPGLSLSGSAPATVAAALLQRLDRYAAKLSARHNRPALTPLQAGRDVCLGADGKPDELGRVMLKALGLYPPGSVVDLVGGEVAIVHSRANKTGSLRVVPLITQAGLPASNLALRDATGPRYAIKTAAAPTSLRMVPPHDTLLAMG